MNKHYTFTSGLTLKREVKTYIFILSKGLDIQPSTWGRPLKRMWKSKIKTNGLLLQISKFKPFLHCEVSNYGLLVGRVWFDFINCLASESLVASFL